MVALEVQFFEATMNCAGAPDEHNQDDDGKTKESCQKTNFVFKVALSFQALRKSDSQGRLVSGHDGAAKES